jgi:hypothetical protein
LTQVEISKVVSSSWILNSGKKIVRRSWDVIPMPDVVINRVNELGKDQPSLMTFTDRHGCLIGDMEIPGVDPTEDEDDYFPGVAPVIADAIEIPGVDAEGPESWMKFRLHKLRFMILTTLLMTTQLQLR